MLGLGFAMVSFARQKQNDGNGIDLVLTGKKQPELFGKSHRLVKQASIAYEAMKKEAAISGINLYSVSSYRNFEKQTSLWNRKFNRYKESGLDDLACLNKILEYSALPGASRHHWGTDIDLSDLNVTQPADVLNPKHFKMGGVYEKLGEWLAKNANSFGFYEAYTENPDRPGFHYEPWHYSFAEVSKPFLKKFLEIDFHTKIKDANVLGNDLMDSSFWEKYKSNYVLGINEVLID